MAQHTKIAINILVFFGGSCPSNYRNGTIALRLKLRSFFCLSLKAKTIFLHFEHLHYQKASIRYYFSKKE